MSTGAKNKPQALPQPTSRYKELFRKYGRVALGVHFTVYFTCLAGCYVAVERHFDVRGTLQQYGLLSAKAYDETAQQDPAEKSWLDKMVTGTSSSLALAFVCNKALFPIRGAVTVGVTPMVARILRGSKHPPAP